MHPDDLKQLSDLPKFPFTTKDDLRANFPYGMFAVPMDKIVRIHASSGTTGKPTVVGYTRRDIQTWADVCARSIYASGGRRGMKIHVAFGYGLFTGGLGLHYGAEKLGCPAIPVSGGMTERQVKLIVDFEPEMIAVTPSYMLAILDEFRAQGVDPAKSSLQIGIFGAEPWTNAMRAEIEDSLRHACGRHLRPVRGDRARASRTSASRPRTACTSGRITSIRRSSIRRPARCCPTASRANWCSPRSPRKACR